MGAVQTSESGMTVPPAPPGPLQPPGPPPTSPDPPSPDPPLPDRPLPDPSPSEPDPMPDPDTFPEQPRQPKPVFLWYLKAFEPYAAAGFNEDTSRGPIYRGTSQMYAEQVLPELDRSAASRGGAS